MSYNTPFMYPAKLVSYDKTERTANVVISGLTDGVPEGITAMLAYPIGDDDLDTERELLAGADVWVFFEQGDTSMPVISHYRRHGTARAVTDVRRIRQKNIELLARANLTLHAVDLVHIKAKTVTIDATTLNINADVNHQGNTTQTGHHTMTGNISVNGSQTIKGESVSYGNQTINGSVNVTVDLKVAGKSTRYHKHTGDSGGTTSIMR